MHDPGPAFRALHQPGNPFILANAWDIGSARLLAALGAQALATSSSAFAFTLGVPDGGITRDQALAHAQDMVAATPLPVSGDFEDGFGADPDTVAETVRLAAEVGLAGISIEDNPAPPAAPYDRALATERIKAAAAAARALPRDFVLVARADGILNGHYGMEEAMARLQAFDDAGADCLYAPIPPSFDDLAKICAMTEKPVNALVAGPFASYTREDFARIGAARLSLGGGLARAAQRRVMDAFSEMIEDGSFAMLKKTVSGAKVDDMLRQFMG
ncbi:isocitrate lyase/phosphoenolpyruvate mutase family protein [Pseudooceanicola sp.]|uniref:isocitrate lyase/phosphoenolpyruvate mutase family protein n=1 Tax=Pseudooceanicola sp. TaxID=1914328 RepID=UPI0035C67082